MAFEATGFDDFCRRLDQAGHQYRTSIRDEIGLRQIFVSDPNQVSIELNFRAPL